MKYILLILVFVLPSGTEHHVVVNMPDMETCEQIADVYGVLIEETDERTPVAVDDVICREVIDAPEE